MPVGFGVTTQTKDQFVSEVLRSSKKIRLNHDSIEDMVEHERKMWDEDYLNREYEYTIDDLFDADKYKKELEIVNLEELDIKKNTATHGHLVPKLMGVYGMWNLMTAWDTRWKYYDFTISTFVGCCTMFHPLQVEQSITNKFSRKVYETYRERALDDLPKLQTLVDEVRKKIDYYAHSITCCYRSTRLCESVGIPVKRELAFLLPYKYQ